jgi:hypothetical protein
MALDSSSVPELLSEYEYKFPEFAPFDFAMECGYQYTNFDKNSRKVAENRIVKLRERVNIDTCSALETVAAIAEIELD